MSRRFRVDRLRSPRSILSACTHPHSPCEPACVDCWNAGVAARRAARKAQLDTMLRCEATDCTKSATWNVQGIGMCGWHKKLALRPARPPAGLEFLAMFG